jgi:hypothetical protein
MGQRRDSGVDCQPRALTGHDRQDTEDSQHAAELGHCVCVVQRTRVGTVWGLGGLCWASIWASHPRATRARSGNGDFHDRMRWKSQRPVTHMHSCPHMLVHMHTGVVFSSCLQQRRSASLPVGRGAGLWRAVVPPAHACSSATACAPRTAATADNTTQPGSCCWWRAVCITQRCQAACCSRDTAAGAGNAGGQWHPQRDAKQCWA